MVTTCADLVVVGFGVKYVMNVVTTVGPTVTTVVEVRVLTDGWPPASVSMATHCSYQMFPSNLQYAPGGHCVGPVYVCPPPIRLD
jgi:hypothetical protein